MTREIICVYQDCIMCGDRGKKVKKLIFDNNLNVRKVSFASDEGRHLIHEAIFEHGIGTLPLFTNGRRFSDKLEDFVPKTAKKSNKTNKTKKTGGNVKNEPVDKS